SRRSERGGRHALPRPCGRGRMPVTPSNPAPVPLRRVQPFGIYVARKDCFMALVRGALSDSEAKREIFNELPLKDHGWNREHCRLTHLTNRRDGMVFRVERLS